MIYVPHHTKNSKIHDDIRSKPGNRVVVLRKKRHVLAARLEKYFLSKASLSIIVIIGIVVMSSNVSRLKADEVIFYPNACLGGFDSPKLAEQKPETSIDASKGDFDQENSAILSKTKNAELYCGNFDGDVNEGTVPQSIVLTVHMSTKDTTESRKIDGDDVQQAATEALDGVSSKEVVVDGKNSTQDSVPTDNKTAPSVPSEKSEGKPADVSVPATQPAESVADPSETTNTPQAPQSEPETHAFLPIKWTFFEKVFAEEGVAQPEETTPQVPESAPAESAPLLEVAQQSSESQKALDDQNHPVVTESAAVTEPPLVSNESSEVSTTTNKIADTEIKEDSSKGGSILSKIFSSEEKAAPLLHATSSVNAVFELKYSTGNDEWTSLALLSNSESKTFSIVLPYTPTSWKDLSTFQIMLHSLENFDERKDLYVDGMELHISYGPKDGIEKSEEREYHASNVQNQTEEYVVSLSGERGERQFISLFAKEQVGVAFYSLDTEAMVMSTSASNATSSIDPNGSLPEYGPFAVVFTKDPNWCNEKTLSECITSDDSVGLSYFSLFASLKKNEGKDISLKKKNFEKLFLSRGEKDQLSSASTSILLDQTKNVDDTQHTKLDEEKVTTTISKKEEE